MTDPEKPNEEAGSPSCTRLRRGPCSPGEVPGRRRSWPSSWLVGSRTCRSGRSGNITGASAGSAAVSTIYRKVRDGRHNVEKPLAAVLRKLSFLQQDFAVDGSQLAGVQFLIRWP